MSAVISSGSVGAWAGIGGAGEEERLERELVFEWMNGGFVFASSEGRGRLEVDIGGVFVKEDGISAAGTTDVVGV